MTILISGATGAVGPYVVAELERQNYTLSLMARLPFDSPHRVLRGNLLDMESCHTAVQGIETVVHLAAVPEPSPDTFETNVQGTYNLLEAAREAGVRRFILASSNCVYGHCYPVSGRPFQPTAFPIRESEPSCAQDNYGLSKRLCEEMLETYSRAWGMETAAFRLNWVWGAEEVSWWRNITSRDPARFAPYFWAYVDARDVGRAVRLALEEPDLPPYGVYNLTAADHMAEESSPALAQQFYPGAQLADGWSGHDSFFDGSAAYRAFGFKAHYSWRQP